MLFVVRPLVRRVITSDQAAIAVADVPALGLEASTAIGAAPPAPPIQAVPSQTARMIDMAQVQGQVHAQSIQKVGELASRNPNETVSIIREWLQDTPA
jgi:flagellar M-ring protein FliF